MDRWSRRQVVQGVGLAGLGVLAGCGRWPGQSLSTQLPKIGFLSPAGASSSTVAAHLARAFHQGLGALGYIEGQNIVLEWRDVESDAARISEVVTDLVRLPVDLLVVSSNDGAQAAKQLTTRIPIVCASMGDPVGTGLVASLARPGGNLTGLSVGVGSELQGKRLDLLRDTVPWATLLAVLWTPAYRPSVLYLEETERVAQAMQLEIISLEVRSPDDFEPAFETASIRRADALLTLGSPFIDSQAPQLVELIAKSRLPAMHTRREWAASGGMMVYGVDFADLYRRAASYVDKILKGAKAGDLPVEQPTKFDFVINLKTAQALGLSIPPHVLLQATEVIQ